jgi:PEP-CTERM putative exosortase interaction domain
MPKKISCLISTAVAVTALACPYSAMAERFFTANLTGSQENPPTSSTATGTANFVLNDAQTALRFNAAVFGLDFTGLQTPDSGDNLLNAHIHAPGPPGTNAPVVWGFIGTPFNDNNPNDVVVTPFGTGVGGIVSGKWDTPEGNGTTLAAQLANILAGNAYINFHTVQFPGGAIRGQIVAAVPEPMTLSLMAAGLIAAGGIARRRRTTGQA